jgi:hypothetical protein
MVQPKRFTEEKIIKPNHDMLSSGTQSIGIQSFNQGHQMHAVTKDNLQSTRSQGSNPSDAKSQGTLTREKVEATQSQHGQAISTGSSGVLTHGAALKKDVHVEQDKGVVRRVAGKGFNEAKEIANDAYDLAFGESQQK